MGIEKLKVEVERLKQENEQLREALRKCDPLTKAKVVEPCIYRYCVFCDDLYDHKDDCEYVRLTEGKE